MVITTLPTKIPDTDPEFFQLNLKELSEQYHVQLITKPNERYYLIQEYVIS